MPTNRARNPVRATRWLTAAIAAAAIAVPPTHAQTAERQGDTLRKESLSDLLQRAERDYRVNRGRAMLSRLSPSVRVAPPLNAAEPVPPVPAEPVRLSPPEPAPPAGHAALPPARPLAAVPPVTIAPNAGAGESLPGIAPKVPEVKAREIEPAPPASAAVPKPEPPRAGTGPERAATYAPADAPAPPPAAVERRLAPAHCRDLLARAQLGDVTQAEMTLLRTQCR